MVGFIVIALIYATIGLNTSKRLPFTTIGFVPQMLRGIHMTYIAVLVLVLCSSYNIGREIIFIFDTPPTQEKLEKLFTPIEKCELNKTNFYSAFNIYFASHFFGWIIHGLILRDFAILHTWSVLTEIVEYTFQNWMPIYAECWWDSLLIDLILSNIPGMIIARLLINAFGWEDFDWFGRVGKKNILHWDIWYNHKRLFAVSLVMLCYILQFFGCFFPGNTMVLNVTSHLTTTRLAIWGSMGYLAYKELYIYASEPVNKKNSIAQPEYLWTPLFVCFLELFMVMRWSEHRYFKASKPLPMWLVGLWIVGISLVVGRITYLKIKHERDVSSGKI